MTDETKRNLLFCAGGVVGTILIIGLYMLCKSLLSSPPELANIPEKGNLSDYFEVIKTSRGAESTGGGSNGLQLPWIFLYIFPAALTLTIRSMKGYGIGERLLTWGTLIFLPIFMGLFAHSLTIWLSTQVIVLTIWGTLLMADFLSDAIEVSPIPLVLAMVTVLTFVPVL